MIEAIGNRYPISVRQYAESDCCVDEHAYWYLPADADMGLDPWRLIDSIEPFGVGYYVWFANGGFKYVDSHTTTIYVPKKLFDQVNDPIVKLQQEIEQLKAALRPFGEWAATQNFNRHNDAIVLSSKNSSGILDKCVVQRDFHKAWILTRA